MEKTLEKEFIQVLSKFLRQQPNTMCHANIADTAMKDIYIEMKSKGWTLETFSEKIKQAFNEHVYAYEERKNNLQEYVNYFVQQPIMQLLYLCSELFTKSIDLSSQLVNHGAILTDNELEYHYLRLNYQQMSTSILVTVSMDFPYYSNPNIDLTTIFAGKEFAKNLDKFCWDSRGEFDQTFRFFTKDVLRIFEFPRELEEKIFTDIFGEASEDYCYIGEIDEIIFTQRTRDCTYFLNMEIPL